MAKLTGGIFSNVSGQTGGIVFGAARTRQGKVVTARQKVIPANPNTPAQQIQRTKFKECQDAVRGVGASIYQIDWNRAISQLPGFQSMNSVFLNSMNNTFVLVPGPDINLGLLHFPDTLLASSPSAGVLRLTYSVELGANGTDADQTVAFAIPETQAGRADHPVITSIAQSIRSDGQLDISGLDSDEDYYIGFYFRGAGTALNTLTLARFLLGNPS